MTKNNLKMAMLAAAASLASQAASARDDHLQFPIADALATADAQAKINPNVKLYWGDQASPTPTQQIGTLTSNRKTNAVGKSDKDACNWAFLSAILALQEGAVRDGGNAIVNIHSVYKNDDVSSTTQYVCGAGSMMSGVALRGNVVKLP